MLIVICDLDAAWEEARDIAPELYAELHSALLRQCGLTLVLGPIDEHP